MSALHGDFRSIVDAGTARHGKQNCQLCEIFIQILHIRTQAFCVMGIQKIKQHIIGLLHIAGIAAVNGIFKILIGQALINPEILNTLSQRIIHNPLSHGSALCQISPRM